MNGKKGAAAPVQALCGTFTPTAACPPKQFCEGWTSVSRSLPSSGLSSVCKPAAFPSIVARLRQTAAPEPPEPSKAATKYSTIVVYIVVAKTCLWCQQAAAGAYLRAVGHWWRQPAGFRLVWRRICD